MITAALGTLPFIATLWLLFVLAAAILQESSGKIRAALKGDSVLQPSTSTTVRRLRIEVSRPAARRQDAAWRAAA